MTKKLKLQPIILSGGSGTRLWPLSRESFPKQYIKLKSSDELSFLQKTQKRLEGLKNIENPIIICNEEQRFLVAEQMRQIGTLPKSIILEPFGKNTAPAIAIAALKALENDQESILLVLSSDHEIKDPSNFRKAVEIGLNDAENEKLVTFGIKPEYPETGYGYIETIENFSLQKLKSLKIKNFIEKPNSKKANEYFKKNHFLWNSGIFLFKSNSIINALKLYEPELLSSCKQALTKSSKDFDFQRLDKDSFGKCANISIDNAIMEKTRNACVIPLNAGWSDVGNWGALWEIEKKDQSGNVITGDIFLDNVKDSYVYSKKNLLVGIDLQDLIIVQTDDATLVANKNRSQGIKEIVNKLNLENRKETKIHRKVFRPWGYYFLIEEGPTWKVKEICVNPNSSLSLQKHLQRSEHWVVIKGIATVIIDKKEYLLKENQSTYIPVGSKHRLSNNEVFPLKLIEVQCGNYLGEDDIFRFDDNYGRIN